jgi:hypothetical protein
MTTSPPAGSDGTHIRITRDEALGRHVDDLLQRQRSLRGQSGVGAERRTPWYLRNWLVLGLAGCAGALIAWAIIEPSFQDNILIRGEVKGLEEGWSGPTLPEGERILGAFQLESTTVWVPGGARMRHANGAWTPAELSAIEVGKTVGAYVDYVEQGERGFAVASWIVLDPEPGSGARPEDLPSLERRSSVAAFLLFAVVAGFVGLAVGAVDGLVCRLPRRALLAGGVGLCVGLLGGLLSTILAGAVYMPLTVLAQKWMRGGSLVGAGFLVQVAGRGFAWMVAGSAMGLGQGVALRSKRLLLFGLLGGVIGGLVGGLLFDPIDFIIFGPDKPGAEWSRMIGLAVIGLGVGVMIGVVELLARDAWLRMTEGPLAGKEFLLFKDVLRIGASSRSDIYLFSDPLVAEQHATLRAIGDEYELENHDTRQPALVNGRSLQRGRLRHGDQITIGRTVFVFQRRRA